MSSPAITLLPSPSRLYCAALHCNAQGRFKLKQKDAVVNNKQASWQAFQTKGAKKKAKGSMAAVSLKKGSIFASPEGLEGKVGVTGSGQGITEQAARKKFKTIK